jgi:hypothetical protein
VRPLLGVHEKDKMGRCPCRKTLIAVLALAVGYEEFRWHRMTPGDPESERTKHS